MGGCCCCSSKRTASEGAPVYYYCPQDFGENEPLSSTRDTPSAVPVHLVDPNLLDTAIPDAYEDHNALLPLVGLINTQANTSTENGASKKEHRPPTDSVQAGDEVGGDRFEGADGLIGSVPKSVSDCVSNSPKVKEDLSNLDKFISLTTDEEDVCPICLEEYDAENPRIVTKCKHHFHLSCILEWLERSNNCAMCDKIMEVEDMDLLDWPL